MQTFGYSAHFLLGLSLQNDGVMVLIDLQIRQKVKITLFSFRFFPKYLPEALGIY